MNTLSRPAFAIVLTFALTFCSASAGLSVSPAARHTAQTAPEGTALLHALWTPAERAGTDADRIVGAIGAPDPTAPGPTAPDTDSAGVLPALPAVPGAMRGAIRRVSPPGGRKVAAITFDLCERANNVAGYNNQIINLLREQNVRATFFAGGKWMRSHPEKTMQLMADPRFELGSHTWTHGNLALMSRAEIIQQMRLTEVQYALLRAELAGRAKTKGLEDALDRVPQRLRLMRLPYGRSSELALDTLAELGYPVIQWDVAGEDGEEAALARVRPGSIVLLHANAVPKNSFQVLKRLVAELRARGYELLTVSELLRLGTPESVRDGYFTEPGDNLRYDSEYPGKGTLHPDPTRPATGVPVPPLP